MKRSDFWTTVFLVGAVSAASGGPCVFRGDFAPQEGFVRAPELPLRQELCLNGPWRFQPVPVPAGYVWEAGVVPELPPPRPDGWDRVPIKIPSPWNVNHWGNGPWVGAGTDRPYAPDSVYYPSYPDAWIHCQMAWLERTFRVPSTWPSACRIVLHFESVAGDCQIWVNEKKVGTHFDKYLPFDVDVTDVIARGTDNTLRVGVRGYRLFDRRDARYSKMVAPYPNGSNTDRLSGIWQDVSLVALPAVRVRDVFVQPWVDRDALEAVVELRNDTAKDSRVAVSADVSEWVNDAGTRVLDAPVPRWHLGARALSFDAVTTRVPAHGSVVCTLKVRPDGRLKLWSPEAPNLYGMLIRTSADSLPVDVRYQRFGWRQFSMRGRDLLLNGNRLQLMGDLCHPFGAYMASRRFVWSWYRMIKDMHGNAVRPHAQIYPRCYIELADEMGLCVLDETAVFGSSIRSNFEAPEFWTRYADHFEGLIRRDRNNPSVVGWSFGNEMFAVFRLNGVQGEDERRWYGELAKIGRLSQALDPTRPWLSCDGDGDLGGVLSVWSKHYGHNVPPLADDARGIDKPLMVGESGGTYYARPSELAGLAGERAYLDYAGRNEALGVDVYQNVVRMARPNLAYFSASETVWFGLEPLPFGFDAFARLPGRRDGVFFEGAPSEGKFGMQIERLPPYVASLNPGWDPSLPLYRPLAMFEAQKAAQDPRGPQPCAWDHVLTSPPRPLVAPPTVEAVAYAGGEQLRTRLAAWGVRTGEPRTRLLVLDAEQLPADAGARCAAVVAEGGTVLVMADGAGADAAAVSALLPAPVRFTARSATALERGDEASALTSPFALADLYFAEEEPATNRWAMMRGLEGAFVSGGTVVLTASRTDWSLFNRRPEEEKVGAVACYEHLVKPSGAALVTYRQGRGEWVVSTIRTDANTAAWRSFWKKLFEHMGVRTAVAQAGCATQANRERDLLLDGPQR